MIVAEVAALFGFKVDQRSTNEAQRTLQNVVRFAKVAGAAIAGSAIARNLSEVVTETARLGDQTAKTAEKLGVTGEALQELRFAAGQTGVEQRTLDLALQRFTRRAAEAAQGTGEAKAALQQMGIQLRDTNGNLRPTDALLSDVADSMAGTQSQSERLRLAFKLFDSEGAALVNTLKGGSAELEALREEARLLGGVMDQELLDASEAFTDSQGRLALVSQGVRNIIAKELLPTFTRTIESTINWVRQNRELLKQNISGFIERVVAVVGRLSRFFGSVAEAVVDFVTGLTPLQRGLLGAAAAAAALAVALALPFGPFLILAGLIALLVDDFQTFREGGESAIGNLLAAFDELVGGAGETAAMVTGFIDKMLASINSFAELGIGALSTLIEFIVDVFSGNIEAAFFNLQANLGAIWQTMLEFLTNLFSETFVANIEEAWEGLLSSIRSGFDFIGGLADTAGEFFGQFLNRRGGAAEDQPITDQLRPAFASATAAQAGRANVVTQTNNPTVNQTINVGGSNASPEQIAQAGASGLTDSMGRMIRNVSEDVGIGGAS